MENVVTTVKADKFINLLKISKYNQEEIEFLGNGFKKGFDIGYQGPQNRQSTSKNIPFTVRDKLDLWNKVMKEVKNKWVTGPYTQIPFRNYIQSLIGLVPKARGDQTRLIFHLSYENKLDDLGSVNSNTPAEICSVKYRDIDYAVHAYARI